jgi:hypothetical protein
VSFKKQELFILHELLGSLPIYWWEFCVGMSVTISIEIMFGLSLPPVVGELVSYLCYLCLFACGGVHNT